jgi:hypothetical protein
MTERLLASLPVEEQPEEPPSVSVRESHVVLRIGPTIELVLIGDTTIRLRRQVGGAVVEAFRDGRLVAQRFRRQSG